MIDMYKSIGLERCCCTRWFKFHPLQNLFCGPLCIL